MRRRVNPTRAALEAVIDEAVTGGIDILDWSRSMSARTTAAASRSGRRVKGVRLDLKAVDHERLERCARERGLNKASYARQAVLERIKTDEGR